MKDEQEDLEAGRRYSAGTASLDDVLLLAKCEAQRAIEALPPHAVAPQPNSLGEVVRADPFHASACALRAYGFLLSARKMIGVAVEPKRSKA